MGGYRGLDVAKPGSSTHVRGAYLCLQRLAKQRGKHLEGGGHGVVDGGQAGGAQRSNPLHTPHKARARVGRAQMPSSPGTTQRTPTSGQFVTACSACHHREAGHALPSETSAATCAQRAALCSRQRQDMPSTAALRPPRFELYTSRMVFGVLCMLRSGGVGPAPPRNHAANGKRQALHIKAWPSAAPPSPTSRILGRSITIMKLRMREMPACSTGARR